MTPVFLDEKIAAGRRVQQPQVHSLSPEDRTEPRLPGTGPAVAVPLAVLWWTVFREHGAGFRILA